MTIDQDESTGEDYFDSLTTVYCNHVNEIKNFLDIN